MSDQAGRWVVTLIEPVRELREIRRLRRFDDRDEARAWAMELLRTYTIPETYDDRLHLKHDDDNYTLVFDGNWGRYYIEIRVSELLA